MKDSVEISRGELFTDTVDDELAKRRARQGKPPAAPVQVSWLRRQLNNSLVYMPFFGLLAGLLAHFINEPHVHDVARVTGEIVLINTDPFDASDGEYGFITITVDNVEINYLPEHSRLEPGEQGQPAPSDVSELQVGDMIDVSGITIGPDRVWALAVRRASADAKPVHHDVSVMWVFLSTLLTGGIIAMLLLLAEGFSNRNWSRTVTRVLVGTLLAAAFAVIALIIGAILSAIAIKLSGVEKQLDDGQSLYLGIKSLSPWRFMALSTSSSVLWASVGAGLAVGMNLVGGTKAQIGNAVVGGAIGGAVGGLFLYPLYRFTMGDSYFLDFGTPRLISSACIGITIGFFIALVDRLAREAWVRVKTGPLAGKAFVLYKSSTVLGSAPACDIYLFKDAEIDAEHAQIHKVGTHYEIEDMDSRMGTQVGDHPVRRRRLAPGDQVILGATILEFEEREPKKVQA